MDDYIGNPTKIRVFQEDDHWSIDAVDDEGGFTEYIWTGYQPEGSPFEYFKTFQDALFRAPEFAKEHGLTGLPIIVSATSEARPTTTDPAVVAAQRAISGEFAPKRTLFMVAWTGGYEAPQFKVERSEEEAVKTAQGWASEAAVGDEPDRIEIIRINPNLTIEHVEFDPKPKPVGIHEIRSAEGDGNVLIAATFPASPEAVNVILNAHEDGPDELDGRSPWQWVLLANGDWMLGLFPHGDTYMETEPIRDADWNRAKGE